MFDEPMLRGTVGQPAFAGLKLTHFQEKRSPELSLDRLGATGIDRRVREHLVPRAEAAAHRFQNPLRFDGWCIVAAKELENAKQEPKFPVIASPVTDPEPLDNAYHAHIVRPDTLSVHMMSLQLRHIFTTYGGVERNEPGETREPTSSDRIRLWLSQTWARITGRAGEK
jgi:hypothetical protein